VKNSIIQIAIATAAALAISQLAQAENLQLRTSQVGNNIVGIASDGRMFAIVCHHISPLSWSSKADLLSPNSKGDIVIAGYNTQAFRTNPAAEEKSPYLPLEKSAVLQICNHPNGVYTLNVTKKADTQVAEYISGQSLEPDSDTSSRGY
jgi:hypothetical protein